MPEYIGFKIIDPTVDMGFDIAAEYAEACRVREGRNARFAGWLAVRPGVPASLGIPKNRYSRGGLL